MGTEEFWIPAVIAAAGATAQGVNTMNANKRQQTAEVQAIDNQNQYRNTANSQVKDLTDQIARNNPQQLAAKETGDFVKTLRQNQGGSNPNNISGPTSALTPIAGASSHYKAGTTAAQAETQKYGDTQAGEISAMDAAIRQRQNEGLAQNTLGTNLNLLGAQSQSKNFVDQLRAQAVGQANPWVGMFGKILQQGAGAYATNANTDPYGGWLPKVGNSAPSAEFTNTVNPLG